MATGLRDDLRDTSTPDTVLATPASSGTTPVVTASSKRSVFSAWRKRRPETAPATNALLTASLCTRQSSGSLVRHGWSATDARQYQPFWIEPAWISYAGRLVGCGAAYRGYRPRFRPSLDGLADRRPRRPGRGSRLLGGRRRRSGAARAARAIFLAWGCATSTSRDRRARALRGPARHRLARLGMLSAYDRELERAAGRPRRRQDRARRDGTALLDGGGGIGHAAADAAIKLAIEKARATGVAAVAVRNSGHFGAAGSYAGLAATRRLIALVTTGTRIPSLVPTFGVEAMLGTNPIAFAAAAARNRPFLLDMATSTAPLGRLGLAAHRGRSRAAGRSTRAAARSPMRARRRYRRLTPLGRPQRAATRATVSRRWWRSCPRWAAGRTASATSSWSSIRHAFVPAGGFAPARRATGRAPRDAARRSAAGTRRRRSGVATAERRRTGIPLARSVVEDSATSRVQPAHPSCSTRDPPSSSTAAR